MLSDKVPSLSNVSPISPPQKLSGLRMSLMSVTKFQTEAQLLRIMQRGEIFELVFEVYIKIYWLN